MTVVDSHTQVNGGSSSGSPRVGIGGTHSKLPHIHSSKAKKKDKAAKGVKCFHWFVCLCVVLMAVVLPHLGSHTRPGKLGEEKERPKVVDSSSDSYSSSFSCSPCPSYGCCGAKEAYVIYLPFNGNRHYLFQGAVLVWEISRVDTTRPFVVLYGEDFPVHLVYEYFGFLMGGGVPENGSHGRLRIVGVHSVKGIRKEVFGNYMTQEEDTGDALVHKYTAFLSKLSLFQLQEYSRVMYLDIDMIVRTPTLLMDMWSECPPAAITGAIKRDGFDAREEPRVAVCGTRDYALMGKGMGKEGGSDNDIMNAGMMIAYPSLPLFLDIMDLLEKIRHRNRANDFANMFNFRMGEQDVLHFLFKISLVRLKWKQHLLPHTKYNRMHVENEDPTDAVLVHIKAYKTETLHPHLEAEYREQIKSLIGHTNAIPDKNERSPIRAHGQLELDKFRYAIQDYLQETNRRDLLPLLHIPEAAKKYAGQWLKAFEEEKAAEMRFA
eukprot:Nk52_evm2s2650 gene=Nk52_evmTU2s2650